MDKEKLNTFIRLLQKVRKEPSQTFDLGLVVKESKNRVTSNKALEAIKKITKIERIIYDKSMTDEDLIAKVIESFKGSKWIFIEIKKDIGSLLLNQLKHLANYNSLQLVDYQGKDLFEIKIPETARVIIFAERDFIEKKITYPHFYRLFGPTLNL